MGKILKPLAIIAAIVVNVIPGVGQALSAAIVTAITTAGVTAALGYAASALGLGPKSPEISQATRGRLSASIDPTAARKLVFGRTAMATDIRYQEWTGNDQEYLHQIICLASHTITSCDELWLDDKLAWTSAGGVQGEFVGYLTVTPRLVGTPGNTITIGTGAKWGPSRRMTGLAYLYLRFKVTGNSKKKESPFAQSVPSRMTVVGKGMPVYDPRFDSTAGGSGPMRANDQTTWAYQTGAVVSGRNPACQLLTFLLGWQIFDPATGIGKLAVGRGIPAERFDMAAWITAANACDETVALAAGGTEPRYRGDGIFSENDDPRQVIEAFETTANAKLRDGGGRFAFTVLSNDLANVKIALDDSDVLGDFQWSPKAPIDRQYNEIRGRFTDPRNVSLYQLVDYPRYREPPIDGIERVLPFDLPLVQSGSQAQRLVKQAFARLKYQGRFEARFGPRGWAVQLGDIVTLSFSALGWENRLFRVVEHGIRPDGVCALVLQDEHPDIYLWDADERHLVEPVELVPYDPQKSVLLQLLVAGEIDYSDGFSLEDYQPAEPGADITNLHTAANTEMVGGRTATQVENELDDAASATAANAEQITDILVDVADLQTTYGDTASAAASATAAETARDVALAAQANAEQAESDAQSALAAAETEADNAAASATAALASENSASTYASNASTSATNAAGSAASASTSAGNAANSATSAGNSASAASGSASSASTSASNAASSATAAAASATSASTSAGNASTSASQAATSATNAAGSASSAATSASTSATSAVEASVSPKGADLVRNSEFANGFAEFSRSGSAPGNHVSQPLVAHAYTAAYQGRSHVAVNSSNAAETIYSKPVKIDLARKYRAQAWVYATAANLNVLWTIATYTSAGALIWSNDASQYFTGIPTNVWTLLTFDINNADLAANTDTISVAPRTNHLANAGSIALDNISLFDVTESVAAAGSATAAATSASSAAVSATTAGTSASSAQTSATNAATSAGNASTSASAASTSATGAAGSASAASTSASTAATYRDQAATSATNAAGSATSAANSASTASTQASNASASASSASTSASTAATHAGNASTSAGNAAGSATAAASSASTASSAASSASADAAAALSSATLAANIGTLAINRNPGFDTYANATVGTIPANWDGTATGAASGYRVADPQGGYAYRLPGGAGANAYAGYKNTADQLVTTSAWYVLEADIVLRAGALTGAGVAFRPHNSGGSVLETLLLTFATDPDASNTVRGAGTVGQAYSFRKLVRATVAGAKGFDLLAASHWTAFGSTAAANDIEWRRCAVRPATVHEIRDQTVLVPLEASVAVNAGAITTLQGRTTAFWQVETVAGLGNGATAFISARAETSPGSVSSTVAFGAREIHLYNPTVGGWAKSLSVFAGEVVVYGNLTASAGIFLGSGVKWQVALRSKTFTVQDGVAVSYGLDFGAPPAIEISTVGLAPLGSGETYNLYPDLSTGTGFTPRLKIITPGTTTNYSLTTDTAPGSGPTRQIDKAANPDATNNQYTFVASGTFQAYAYYEDFGGPGGPGYPGIEP